MRIVHFAPFAPCACGLYEAARDMTVADILAGHESFFVDTGTTNMATLEHTPGASGKVDERGGSTITTADPSIAATADVFIAHTGVPDPWISPSQAPMIWIMHGRPAACFGPEQFHRGNSYTLLANLATWPRVKAMLSFWPYHEQFWRVSIPNGKLVVFPSPPIDGNRFSPEGPTHDFGALGGKWNIILAESWREDVDIFEITHGAIALAQRRKDVKFHFYAMESPLRCWEYPIAVLRDLGALGEVWARRPNIEEIYRAADILLSPQCIATRTVGEAMSCGTPVVAAEGCAGATITMNPSEPGSVANALEGMLIRLEDDRDKTIAAIKIKAKELFALDNYNIRMQELYHKVLGKE